MNATATVRIGGRDIKLRYDMMAYEVIEGVEWPELPTDTDEGLINGFARMSMAWHNAHTRFRTLCSLVVILGNNCAEYEGREQSLTFDWVAHHLVPGQMVEIHRAVQELMDAGNAIGAELDEGDDHDVIAEEIAAKKEEAGG